jgi:hypothetical protein
MANLEEIIASAAKVFQTKGYHAATAASTIISRARKT